MYIQNSGQYAGTHKYLLKVVPSIHYYYYNQNNSTPLWARTLLKKRRDDRKSMASWQPCSCVSSSSLVVSHLCRCIRCNGSFPCTSACTPTTLSSSFNTAFPLPTYVAALQVPWCRPCMVRDPLSATRPSPVPALVVSHLSRCIRCNRPFPCTSACPLPLSLSLITAFPLTTYVAALQVPWCRPCMMQDLLSATRPSPMPALVVSAAFCRVRCLLQEPTGS